MIYEGEWRERIDVAEALRLMIEQIANPIQRLSESVEVALLNLFGADESAQTCNIQVDITKVMHFCSTRMSCFLLAMKHLVPFSLSIIGVFFN